MRITLASPPLITKNPAEPLSLPLGLAYLGAMLDSAGHDVILLDGVIEGSTEHLGGSRFRIGLHPGGLANRILRTKPDLIGLSCAFTPRYRLFSETISHLRQALPSTPIVAGGIHPTIFTARVLRRDRPDAIVLGEGEQTLLEIANRFEQTGRLDIEGLDGTACLNGDEVVVNPRRHYIEDLDALPPPARHKLPVERYLGRSGGRWSSPRRRVLSVLTSRSCPGRCSFCSVHSAFGPRWRGHSPGRVLDELEGIIRDYSPTLIAIEDDRFTWERERVLDICRGIRGRDLKFEWFTPNGVHVSDLDEELLQEMKRSGCRSLNLAVESGDEYILNEVIGKKGSPRLALEAAEMCREFGIKTNGYFVIGMPGETDASIERSLNLCLDMRLDGLGVFIATPFPGTRLHRHCVKAGYLDSRGEFDELLESGDPDLLHKPTFATPTMPQDKLLWWEREFNRRFLNDLYRRKPLVRLRHAGRRLLEAVNL